MPAVLVTLTEYGEIEDIHVIADSLEGQRIADEWLEKHGVKGEDL